MDFDVDDNGQVVFTTPGTQKQSLVSWLALGPTQFALNESETREIQGTVTVPRGASPGSYWAVLMLESEPRVVQQEGPTAIAVVERIALPVYLYVGSVATGGRIVDLEFRGLNPLGVTIRFANTGTALLKDIRCEVLVYDARGSVVAKWVDEGFVALPGRTRAIALSADFRPRPGTYLVVVKVDLGGRQPILAAQKTLRVAELALRPLPGGAVPRDLDGDGFFEDVDGSGALDERDPEVLRVHLLLAQVQANWRAFDFNNDGQVDERDVQVLAARVRGAAPSSPAP